MGKPLCRNTHNRAFSDPDKAPATAVRAAQKMCGACPLLTQCAEQALTSGTSLAEDRRAPASDVIQAGIICRGDTETAYRLATIAGVPVPTYLSEENRRATPPDSCRHCERPMVKWHRGTTPDGWVMHRGRGYCTRCRKAYSADMRVNPARRRGLRKRVDRKRHSAPRRSASEVVVQLPLIGLEELTTQCS